MKPVTVQCEGCGKAWTIIVPCTEMKCSACDHVSPVANARSERRHQMELFGVGSADERAAWRDRRGR